MIQMETPQELVIDCDSGMAHDQDVSSDHLGRQVASQAENLARSQRARDRQSTLMRLRQQAVDDETLCDLLYVLGLLE